ncbi:50S ribosomal protein L15e [Nanoarchaeota archaeon]
MSMYKYIRQAWKRPKATMPELMKERLIQWRKEPVSLRIGKPTRLDRARSLGYKAKPGIFMVRQRVAKGQRRKPNPFTKGGRRPKRMSQRLDLSISYKSVAEQRASKHHVNCEVLNSYEVAKDGKYYWFEVILVDRAHPVIKKDQNYKWISKPSSRNRVLRGKTSTGQKSRGLRNKGKGAEKIRPSRRAHNRKG